MTSTLLGLGLFNIVMGEGRMNDDGDQMFHSSETFIDGHCIFPHQCLRCSLLGSTHQLPLLHALQHHLQDLLRLAFAVVESLLDGDKKLLSDIVTHQAGGEQLW